MAETRICKHCGEAAHVYFCLRDPRYLNDPEGFMKTRAATARKSTTKRKHKKVINGL